MIKVLEYADFRPKGLAAIEQCIADDRVAALSTCGELFATCGGCWIWFDHVP